MLYNQKIHVKGTVPLTEIRKLTCAVLARILYQASSRLYTRPKKCVHQCSCYFRHIYIFVPVWKSLDGERDCITSAYIHQNKLNAKTTITTKQQLKLK